MIVVVFVILHGLHAVKEFLKREMVVSIRIKESEHIRC